MRLLIPLWLLGLAAGSVVHSKRATELRPVREESVSIEYSPGDADENVKKIQKLIQDTKDLTGGLGNTFRSAVAVISKIGGFLNDVGPAAAAITEIIKAYVPGVSLICHPTNIGTANMWTAQSDVQNEGHAQNGLMLSLRGLSKQNTNWQRPVCKGRSAQVRATWGLRSPPLRSAQQIAYSNLTLWTHFL